MNYMKSVKSRLKTAAKRAARRALAKKPGRQLSKAQKSLIAQGLIQAAANAGCVLLVAAGAYVLFSTGDPQSWMQGKAAFLTPVSILMVLGGFAGILAGRNGKPEAVRRIGNLGTFAAALCLAAVMLSGMAAFFSTALSLHQTKAAACIAAIACAVMPHVAAAEYSDSKKGDDNV